MTKQKWRKRILIYKELKVRDDVKYVSNKAAQGRNLDHLLMDTGISFHMNYIWEDQYTNVCNIYSLRVRHLPTVVGMFS